MSVEHHLSVDTLLAMYKRYNELTATVTENGTRVAKAKLIGQHVETLQDAYDASVYVQQKLSDEMTFDTPFIWMEYKYKAYKDEAQPIRTMRDLRQHCSKPGYICTKRFDFINLHLLEQKQKPLSDVQAYEDSLDISIAMQDKQLMKTVTQRPFLEEWRSYEYYRDNKKVAKWMNYFS